MPAARLPSHGIQTDESASATADETPVIHGACGVGVGQGPALGVATGV